MTTTSFAFCGAQKQTSKMALGYKSFVKPTKQNVGFLFMIMKICEGEIKLG